MCTTLNVLLFDLHAAGAVHRYYESRRRLFNDSQPQRRERATEVKHAAQKRKLQQLVYTVIMSVCNSYSSCVAFQKEKKGVEERSGKKLLGFH